MITIKHHGAVAGVTGSCHELTLEAPGGDRAGILVDCGLFQGSEAKDSSNADNPGLDFPIEHIRALVVTHVHLDHIGRIPYLLAAGFSGPILCSEPSALLLPAMLEDALKIGFTRNRRMIEGVLEVIRGRIVALPYGRWHSVFGPGDVGADTRCQTPHLQHQTQEAALAIRLQPAGHILGSAYVECQATCKTLSERIVFSGDLGAPHAPLLPSPKPPERADRLVIEATYGDKDHESREDRRYRLKQVLEHALQDGGTVLIPAFSIGRTQDLLYEIDSLINEFRQQAIVNTSTTTTGQRPLTWDKLEIVVDSPLAATFTDLYRQLKPYWDDEARELLQQGRHPLSFEQLTVINSHDDHLHAVDYLARSHRPCVVLAGSGMCTGGRVVNYLKALLGDARNDILFVGYQAAGTPGRSILAHGPHNGWVELEGTRYTINAQVHQVGGYSAHAGQRDLLAFVDQIPEAPKEVRIVHGDPEAKAALAKLLSARVGGEVWVPSGGGDVGSGDGDVGSDR
ncbi:MBL fold hydrolase [Marinobacter fuscus]|uniref:MBL fold hydrolase n=1 Tax=Marinobacter fuscus TaxID=2109942 RepID=A0A2T1K4C1_9GAMM|nr:MBL fold metallo-hydrolase [Marinobacter fuscus]PSF04603.1 MBL fold hydrolase [Marinobacter fuscus]